MGIRAYIIIMSIIALICLALWVVVLNMINPTTAGIVGLIIFHVSLFFCITTIGAVVGLLIRRWRARQEFVPHHVVTALRQGGLFGLFVVGLLLFSGAQLFTVVNVLLLVVLLAIIEFYFLGADQVKTP